VPRFICRVAYPACVCIFDTAATSLVVYLSPPQQFNTGPHAAFLLINLLLLPSTLSSTLSSVGCALNLCVVPAFLLYFPLFPSLGRQSPLFVLVFVSTIFSQRCAAHWL